MANAILVPSKIMATDVGSLNRSVVSGSSTDINQGGMFKLSSSVVSASSGYTEVWNTVITSGTSDLFDLWMAYSDELVTVTSGTSEYRGPDPDPRNFTNIGAKVFDAFKPMQGDIILISSDGITGSPSTGAYVNAGSATYTMIWEAARAGSATSFKLLEETYISIGTGLIDTQRVLAYRLECLGNQPN